MGVLGLKYNNKREAPLIAAIFDGHGNASCSSYCSSSLSSFVPPLPPSSPSTFLTTLPLTLDATFSSQPSSGGTTSNILHILPHKITCSNTGDSRSIYVPKSLKKHQRLSIDHNPKTRPDEVRRINELNGQIHTGQFGITGVLLRLLSTIQGVDLPLRVYNDDGRGGLNMTRSLGDVYLKPLVIPDPEIVELEVDEGYIIQATDGLWDVVSNSEVVSCLRDAVKTFETDEEVVRNVSLALTRGAMRKGSEDNITVVVIKI
ncbi:hypothetical protein TrST_g14325 [Triparma strigata]|uniref:PPM-type phosphatase domain-containing protein n=1 Tax=Triparma strigata TaxID=1606541 RepID=A0A9W6ZYF6_9STRA|nr:hypothetical protein TrST_g14325 [Triparma strigata]